MGREKRRVIVGSPAYRRRGTVIPLVAVSMGVVLGFAALTVDVGMLYNARTELQRTADASAMAAAAALGENEAGDPMARARTAAQTYATLNHVLNSPLSLDANSDIVFGRAYIDPASERWVFTPSGTLPNAVQVRARRTSNSPDGPVPTIFANVWGIRSVDVGAAATAVLIPRDIVFVLDLSASHNDDSSLVHYRLTEVALRKVWAHLWDTSLALQPSQNGLLLGPSFGNMNNWGTNVVDPNWNFASDAGLVQLKRGANWGLGAAYASQTLSAKGYGTYTTAEMSVINSPTGAGSETTVSSSTQKANYRRRARVALGLDRWKSGKSGGQAGGNGDNVIDASEVVSMVPYPSSTSNPSTKSKKVGGSWDGFVDYVSDISKADNITSNTGLSYVFLKYDPSNSYYGNPQLRWRFGLKTLLDYVQDAYEDTSSSPGLSGAPEEPMQSVTNAVLESLSIIENLESADQVGTAAYGTAGYGPSDRPSHLSWLTTDISGVQNRVAALQAGMWTSSTNISQGIDKGVKVLTDSPTARDEAAKIMILLTDGKANVSRSGSSNIAQAAADTLTAAREAHLAHPNKIRIYTVSVGADADTDLMEEVARIGMGEHFHAAGDVATYRQQLEQIFRDLGGRRPVVLMQ